MIKENRKQDIKNMFYNLFLLMFAVLVCAISLTDVSFFSLLNVREMGSLSFLFIDVLLFLRIIMEQDSRKKKRVFHLIYACIATVVYMMYCRGIFFAVKPGTTDDALSISGILGILFVFISRK